MNEKKIGRAQQMACETRARTHKMIETIMTRRNWLMQELANTTYHQYFAYYSIFSLKTRKKNNDNKSTC